MKLSMALPLLAAPLLATAQTLVTPPAPTQNNPTPAPNPSPNPPPANSPSPSPSPTPTSSAAGTPIFTFFPISTMTACQQTRVQWKLANVNPADYVVDIYAYNINVDQSVPPPPPPPPTSTAAQPASTSAKPPSEPDTAPKNPSTPPQPPPLSAPPAPSGTLGGGARPARRALAPHHAWNLVARAQPLNVTVVSGWDASVGYNWIPNVPRGRYQLIALVHNAENTAGVSEVFTVEEGSDTSCIDGASDKPSSTSTDTNSKAPKSATSAAPEASTTKAGSAGQSNASKSSGVSGGAIAGIVIGVLAAVAILALLLFCCKRRKQQNASAHRKDIIGSPSDFRKARRSGRLSKFGFPLAGRALNSTTTSEAGHSNGHSYGHSTNPSGSNWDAEKALPIAPAKARVADPTASGYPPRSQSAMSRESENPFETAPSTPIDEKTPQGLDAAALTAATAAAARTITPPGRAATGANPRFPPPHHPRSLPQSAAATDRDSSSLHADSDLAYRQGPDVGPRPQASIPGTPATPGPMYQADTPTHLMAAYAPGHKSERSTSSALDGMLVDAPAVPNATPQRLPPVSSLEQNSSNLPPSSFNAVPTTATPSSPKGPERKTSLRRKPVPKLLDGEDAAAAKDPSPSHSSHGSLSSSNNHARGDQFGLALDTADFNRGLNFQLIPDPPLPQND